VQKYVEELTTAEIAARAGKNEKAAESTLHRARAAFGRIFTLLAKKRGGFA
jgi:DNA-directed RNA polymerase specialized sigma24 family protein